MATLLHHWKINNNLQDAVGDVHLSNISGSLVFTSNKDGVSNSALGNDGTFYAYSSFLTSGFDEDERSYSFWLKKSTTAGTKTYFSDRCIAIMSSPTNDSITVYYSQTIAGSVYGISISGHASALSDVLADEWCHICITLTRSGDKKIFVNSILKGYSSNTTNWIAQPFPFTINADYGNGFFKKSGNTRYIDEIKYFSGLLSDGGATVVGQQATGEVFELYLEGVNNIVAPLQNPASSITGTSALLSWTEG